VGYPGETEELFEETYRFINELDISYLHVFTYSERPDTPAATYPGKVPQRIRQERNTRLTILSEKKRRHFYQTQLGKTKIVLFEEEISEGNMFGYTENYIRVQMPFDPLLTNELIPVTLMDITPDLKVTAFEIDSVLATS
jgi:threonylcarbamoyladenosine tRNA methylthiotransferase MtaB